MATNNPQNDSDNQGVSTDQNRRLFQNDSMERTKQESLFARAVDRYEIGTVPWSLYMARFCAIANRYPLLQDIHKKSVLYVSLGPQAFNLARAAYAPDSDEWKDKVFKEYSKALESLFEPQQESDHAKFEYESRTQTLGENPVLYYRDKLNLYERAYPENQREKATFFRHTLDGLLNTLMKNELRIFTTYQPDIDYNQFRIALSRAATSVRRRYLSGEISESEAIGSEIVSTPGTYQVAQAAHQMAGIQIKSEPINSIQVVNNKPDRRCFHCNSAEHLVAHCPRKAAGLPAIIPNTLVPMNRSFRPMGQNKSRMPYTPMRVQNAPQAVPIRAQNMPQAAANYSYKPKPFQKQKFTPNSQRNRKFKKRIMHVYEDEETGELFQEFEDEPVEEQVDTEQDNAPEVHQVQGEAEQQFPASDYIPGSFLGI